MKVDITFPFAAEVDTREAAAAAESAGYAAIWNGEVKHDPFLGLAVAATTTSTIQLGTSIALAFARNPMSTAVIGNDLQTLSKGRMLLGLGSQVKPHITRRFSMPWSRPAARMREYVLAMRAIWSAWETDERLSFEGDFYSHTLMTPFFSPGPNPYGPPPVYLAGVGELMTAVAGEVADGFLAHGFTTERYLREVTVPVLRQARGGDLTGYEIAGSPFIATGENDEAVQSACLAVKHQIAFYGSTPAYRGVLELHGWGDLADELHALSRQGRWADMAKAVDDEVLTTFSVVGPPEEAAADLVARYGDLLTRVTLYAPYDVTPGLAKRLFDLIST